MLKSTPLAAALALAATVAPAQDLTNTGTQLAVGPGALLAVPGALTNQAGGTLTVAGTVQVAGNLTNAGTLTAGSGIVIFAGSADQTLTPGGASLGRVEIRNSGPAGHNRVLLPQDLTVTQQLLLTTGMLRTAATATLHLPDGAVLSGEAAGRYVQGHVEVLRTNVGGNGDLDFGNGLVLNPQGNSLGTVRVTRAAGLQQAGVSFGQNPANPAQQGIDRIWRIEADQPPAAPVGVTFSWLPDDDNGLTDFSRAQVWRMPENEAAWLPVGPAANATARSLTVSTTSFSRWTVSNAQNPLPVELVSFMAERRGEAALLRWATASEKNNAWFDVEASADSRTFQRIGRVAGQGTSTRPHDYQLTDPDLSRYAAEVVYYRLRQIDQDGTESLSPVRTVRVPAPAGLVLQAYPLPFGAQLTLLLRTDQAGPATLQVLDATGRSLLKRENVALAQGLNTLELPEVLTLPVGVYVLRVTQGRQHQALRISRR